MTSVHADVCLAAWGADAAPPPSSLPAMEPWLQALHDAYPSVVRTKTASGQLVTFGSRMVTSKKAPEFTPGNELVAGWAQRALMVAEDPIGEVCGRLWFVDGQRFTVKPEIKRQHMEEDDSE